MIKIIREDKNSEILVVTPLLPGHKVSKDTKRTIKRNNIPFTWIISEGNNNIPINVENGLNEYRKQAGESLRYLLPLDRDIILGRSMLDRMYVSLRSSPVHIAYTYANFEFRGVVNKEFPAIPFDINSLVFNNYISSNSMIKIECLDKVGGFVKDDKYKRLLDWCLWLKFFDNGFIGLPCPIASFIATSTEDDISTGTNQDFYLKRKRVLEDIVKPLVKRNMEKQYQEANKSDTMEPIENVLSF